MQYYITAETTLFLYNYEAHLLTGRFVAVGFPTLDSWFDATSSEPMAQVEVKPFDLSLHEIASADVSAGPKSVAEVASLQVRLKQGKVLSQFLQKAWNATEEALTAEAGFVFCCNRQTQNECFLKRLFGAPEEQLPSMRHCLKPGTPLLLFNVQTFRLFGPFVAIGSPGTCLDSNAFAGHLNAQVYVALPDDVEVFNEMALRHKITCGEKPAIEMVALRRQLKQHGRPLGADVQQLWDAADGPRAESDRPWSSTTPPPPWRLARRKAVRGQTLPKRPRRLKPFHVPPPGTDGILEKRWWDFVKGRCQWGQQCRYVHEVRGQRTEPSRHSEMVAPKRMPRKRGLSALTRLHDVPAAKQPTAKKRQREPTGVRRTTRMHPNTDRGARAEEVQPKATSKDLNRQLLDSVLNPILKKAIKPIEYASRRFFAFVPRNSMAFSDVVGLPVCAIRGS